MKRYVQTVICVSVFTLGVALAVEGVQHLFDEPKAVQDAKINQP